MNLSQRNPFPPGDPMHATWHGFDPTSGSPIGKRHVIVARGRDYGDVAPLKGGETLVFCSNRTGTWEIFRLVTANTPRKKSLYKRLQQAWHTLESAKKRLAAADTAVELAALGAESTLMRCIICSVRVIEVLALLVVVATVAPICFAN